MPMTHSNQDSGHNPRFDQYNTRSQQKLTVEIPSQPIYHHPRSRPSVFTPMGSIELEGEAWSQLSHGRMPWWIAIACWLMYGVPLSFVFGPSLLLQFQETIARFSTVINKPLSGTEWFALLGMSLLTLCSTLIYSIFLVILVKGTLRKLRRRLP